jgi:1,4-alpha-glucan branching enzyme
LRAAHHGADYRWAESAQSLVDLCHLYGIAVAFDVVYNHAGGFEGDDESIYFWDREGVPGQVSNNESLFSPMWASSAACRLRFGSRTSVSF